MTGAWASSGVSRAHVSVRCTLYPNHAVSRFLPVRATGLIGRTNDSFAFTGWRACSPFGLPTRQVVILLPDLPQQLHTRKIRKFSWCLGLRKTRAADAFHLPR